MNEQQKSFRFVIAVSVVGIIATLSVPTVFHLIF